VKELDKFDIDIIKLGTGSHDYQFEIGNSFFEAFGGEIINKGKGNVNVTLDKNERLIDVTFHLDLEVELTCDRSLEKFDYQIDETEGLIFKYGDEEGELDENIIIIPHNSQRINLAQPIYEFISLAVPMKKLHPRFDGEDDIDELVYTSKKEEKKEIEEKATDPRWEALQKLKKN